MKEGRKFFLVSPHIYTEIEGERVDVALDPELEEIYGKNSGQKTAMPINLSKIRKILCREESDGYR